MKAKRSFKFSLCLIIQLIYIEQECIVILWQAINSIDCDIMFGRLGLLRHNPALAYLATIPPWLTSPQSCLGFLLFQDDFLKLRHITLYNSKL